MGTVMNRRLTGMLTTAFAYCIILSCSERSTTDPTSLTLNDSTADASRVASATVALARSTLEVGQTTKATAILRDSQNRILNRVVVWSSSNTSVATVSDSGLVTALSPGTADIVATRGLHSARATLTVTPSTVAAAPVASVTVVLPKSTLSVGQTIQAIDTTRDSTNKVLTGTTVVWTSSNVTVATIASSGMITARAAGTTMIAATSGAATGTAPLSVTTSTPPPVASISVTPTSSSVLIGATVQLSATTRDASNNVLTGRLVTWSSSNIGISTVSSTGLVTAVALGTATITATSEGKTATSAISVLAPPPPGGSAEPTGMTRITDRQFNALSELGWDDTFSSNMAFMADVTAPKSPAGILRATYPTGYTSSGNGPGGSDYILSSSPRTIYVSFWSKLSSNFFGHDSGTNKQFYVYDLGGNPWFFFSVYGVGSGPLVPMIQFQSTTSNGDYDLAPNLVPSARIPRNAWYHIEVVATGNTAGTADGTIDVWLNGVHVTSTAGLPNGRLQYSSGACHWGRFHYTTIWGGVGGPNVPATMTVDWDDVYLSGKP